MPAYLDLADYLLVAEAVLGVPAERIARWPGIGLAESASVEETVATIEGVAAGRASERELADWLRKTRQ